MARRGLSWQQTNVCLLGRQSESGTKSKKRLSCYADSTISQCLEVRSTVVQMGVDRLKNVAIAPPRQREGRSRQSTAVAEAGDSDEARDAEQLHIEDRVGWGCRVGRSVV